MRNRDKICDELRALSKAHGVNFNTLYQRYHKRGMRGSQLVEGPQAKGKFHLSRWCGRTYDQWLEWYESNGRKISKEALTSTRYRCGQRGMTDFEAMMYYLAYNSLLEKYLEELNQTKLKGELFPYKSSK